MSETKFTKGPWHWHKARTQQHLHNDSCGSFSQVSMPLVHNKEIRPIYDANANLISAAPQLYEALVAWTNMWGSKTASSSSKAAQQRRVELWEKTNAALKKARGE